MNRWIEPWGVVHGSKTYVVTANADGSIPLNAKIVGELEKWPEDAAKLACAAPEMAAALRALSYAFTRPEWQHAIADFVPELEAASRALAKAGLL